MPNPPLPDYSKHLASIQQNNDKKSLTQMLENAEKKGADDVAEACRQRIKHLSDSATRAPRIDNRVAYLGDFEAELLKTVSREDGHRLLIWLPLANERQGNRRGKVAAEIRVDGEERIIIADLDRGTLHSSLSNLRAVYEKKGGGSNSWDHFVVADGRSIAAYIDLDPSKAKESN